MKPGFQATIALYLLKLLTLGSWCDECIVTYFKTFSFSKLERFYSPTDPKINPQLCLDMTYPPVKFQEFGVMSALWYILKLLVLASWQGFYSPTDPKIIPQLCLDMTYSPVKFHVDWSKETQTSSFSKLPRRVHYDIF